MVDPKPNRLVVLDCNSEHMYVLDGARVDIEAHSISALFDDMHNIRSYSLSQNRMLTVKAESSHWTITKLDPVVFTNALLYLSIPPTMIVPDIVQSSSEDAIMLPKRRGDSNDK